MKGVSVETAAEELGTTAKRVSTWSLVERNAKPRSYTWKAEGAESGQNQARPRRPRQGPSGMIVGRQLEFSNRPETMCDDGNTLVMRAVVQCP